MADVCGERALDRLRATFAARGQVTPGFIRSLREAMGLTQTEFGRKLGVSKMTVNRWECGRMLPGEGMVAEIRKLQARARREGIRIDDPRVPRRRSA